MCVTSSLHFLNVFALDYMLFDWLGLVIFCCCGNVNALLEMREDDFEAGGGGEDDDKGVSDRWLSLSFPPSPKAGPSSSSDGWDKFPEGFPSALM